VEVKVKRIDEHGKISLELASAEKKQRERTEPAPAKRKPLLRKRGK
jgi:predicted RNA-binding protein with RPS1 domain